MFLTIYVMSKSVSVLYQMNHLACNHFMYCRLALYWQNLLLQLSFVPINCHLVAVYVLGAAPIGRFAGDY